ncbi:hypothetical protein ACFOWE_24135 [Planomonospora corallina]|uniref:V8-like Glu-specific endopeptidase n=1 Tax=Planomonospora corallina TaxID=1806052 RepID=A0ABV8IBJ5_9ACTN
MKRILIPAGGAVLATGLLAAGLAGTAQANPDWASDTMVKDAPAAVEVAKWWQQKNGEASYFATAKPYAWEHKTAAKMDVGGKPSIDGKPGQAAPIGEEKKTAAKAKNINLPKTIGKVFFVTKDGEPSWCSATSIQGKYRNLVATAGHCVYDVAGNRTLMDKWVFVPGYYQGKTPWGIYVGKTAWVHYDLAVFEDFDRDYAFVTVYDGIQVGGGTAEKVSAADFAKWTGKKEAKPTEVSHEEYRKGRLNPATADDYFAEGKFSKPQLVGPDYPGAVVERVEVSQATYRNAPVGKGNGNKFGEPEVEHVTYAEGLKYLENQQKNPADFPGTVKLDDRTNVTITHYYVQAWIKPGTVKKFYKNDFYIFKDYVKNVGRLGDNVGGQGFAWNQKTQQNVFVFGYPAATHPDGNKVYTGVTPKWCYGKTSAKSVEIPAYKVEEQVALKCSMTPGADGSPWLIKYSNAKRLGYVNGVTSLFIDQDGNKRLDYSTSAYFDGEAAEIYQRAANSWSGTLKF